MDPFFIKQIGDLHNVKSKIDACTVKENDVFEAFVKFQNCPEQKKHIQAEVITDKLIEVGQNVRDLNLEMVKYLPTDSDGLKQLIKHIEGATVPQSSSSSSSSSSSDSQQEAEEFKERLAQIEITEMAYKKLNNELNSRLIRMQKELLKGERDIEKLNRELEETREKVRKPDNEISFANFERKLLVDQLEELQLQNLHLNAKLGEVQNHGKSIVKQGEQALVQNHVKLIEKNLSLSEEVTNLKKIKEKLEEERKQKNKELNEKNGKIKTLQEQFDKIVKKEGNRKEYTEQVVKKVTELNRQVKEKNERIIKLETERKEKEKAVTTLQLLLHDVQEQMKHY